MALKDDLVKETAEIFRSAWSERDGIKVPEPADLLLSNDAVYLDATCLYADMAHSTQLVNGETAQFAAEVYKAFLHCSSKLIKDEGGVITSFDGDRVMGIFIGDAKNTSAVRCALRIKYAVHNIVNPAITNMYTHKTYKAAHAVGVDTSKILAARTGVRGANDIVWVGRAANYAAKLSGIRDGDYCTWITAAVHDSMSDNVRYANNPKRDIWEQRSWTAMGNAAVYRSSYWWID